ncbi:ATP-binding protein [Streptomyces zaomyceticus]|uniref:ATP-binding protein n=1 Tax=Streptomyces zaomyceticus TaxID=68286 RepID=UPI003673CB0B
MDSLADRWSVSDDRTTAWCLLLLAEHALETGPATATAPVRHDTSMSLPANPRALSMASVQGRMLLTLMHWEGNQHTAVQALHVLVDNALRHGITPDEPDQRLEAWLRVTEARELVIDVMDPYPSFPNFDQAVRGNLGRGLEALRRLEAAVSWFPDATGGKTVRVTLQPAQADL